LHTASTATHIHLFVRKKRGQKALKSEASLFFTPFIFSSSLMKAIYKHYVEQYYLYNGKWTKL